MATSCANVVPQDEEVFWLMTGESETSLRPGRKLEARVQWVISSAINCTLPDCHNIDAVVEANHVSSREAQVDCKERAKMGESLLARWVVGNLDVGVWDKPIAQKLC